MKFIEMSMDKIFDAKKIDVDVVIRIETNSGDPKPRLLKIIGGGDDFIIGRGRDKSVEEVFNFNNISSWRFAKHNPEEWKWQFPKPDPVPDKEGE